MCGFTDFTASVLSLKFENDQKILRRIIDYIYSNLASFQKAAPDGVFFFHINENLRSEKKKSF